ncbi:hypothetical protein BKA70DRAFT_54006 [Coprinopsis sp. MPI-PUGE-AT-0042]|nr:hypothetical protein BKA70DRAFT_54006 [Coprinopsis sp. MPI-PUGE-AT-0042]
MKPGKTTMGAFERLPPELIPRILPPLYFFDRPSLFHLALVSKKFYHICLYTYLERIHITNPQEAINVDLLHQIMRKDGRVYDALTVLRLPFLFHDTNSLTCTFPEAMWLPYNGEFIFHIKRLHAVVSRFTQIKGFVLNCYSEGCHPLNGGRGYLEQWMAAMGLLLNTVLEKGCESLEINGLRWASGVYNAVRRPTISKSPPISNVLKNKTWHFSRHSAHLPKTLVHLSDEAQRSTKLQS